MKSVGVTVTASGDTTLVAAPGAGFLIRVLGFVVTSKTALDCAFYSGAAGTLKCPIYSTSDRGGVVVPVSTEGWFDCAQNQGLIFNQSTTGNTGVLVRYAIIG